MTHRTLTFYGLQVPDRHAVRAVFDADTITVYQAYSPAIALPALDAQRFVPPFKRDRMTWVKPSFLWMMYRSGWATKEGQERVLAVRLRRDGFDAAVAEACLSHYVPDLHESREAWSRALRTSPVRVQWDPERDLHLRPLEHRSLQLGLSGAAVHRYVDEWTVGIRDVTPLVHEIHALVEARALEEAAALLPPERPYQ
ncbi:DUF4291 domain-containing protein [Dactylosporangium sp. NPDC006015]|uniref:DUF4291 domain-containing protein n=1 Tax=Dactylosporangium sp. NPDC006015 TaxID=3154576 RepID=UPI0033B7C838